MNTTTKHTPLPWNCTNLDEGYGLPRTVYSELNGLSVASISGVDGDLDRWNANARLIAAAPDLLAACSRLEKAAKAVCDKEHADIPWADMAEEYCELWHARNEVRAAIAKATP